MRDYEISSDILKMFELGIELALITPVRHTYDDFTTMTETIDDDRVQNILNDNSIPKDRRMAFEQQTKLGWSRIFMGYMTEGWRQSTTQLTKRNWTAACLRLFLKWGRACWSHRNTTLFGPSKLRHKQRRRRLQAEARVWINSPSNESLVPIDKYGSLKRDITRATTETIATWIQRQQQTRRLIRDRKKENIYINFQTEEALQAADRKFHQKIIAARCGAYTNTATINTNEEPPD